MTSDINIFALSLSREVKSTQAQAYKVLCPSVAPYYAHVYGTELQKMQSISCDVGGHVSICP